MRTRRNAPGYLRVPRSLHGRVEANSFCEQIQSTPVDQDLLVDFRKLDSIGPDEAQLIADTLFWRACWSHVGCIIDAPAIIEAFEQHRLPQVLTVAATARAARRAMAADHRPSVAGRMLVMGPGPAATAA